MMHGTTTSLWHIKPPSGTICSHWSVHSPSDTESGLVSQCPWCDLKMAYRFWTLGYTVGTPQRSDEGFAPRSNCPALILTTTRWQMQAYLCLTVEMPQAWDQYLAYCSARMEWPRDIDFCHFQIMSENCKNSWHCSPPWWMNRKRVFQVTPRIFCTRNQSCCSIQHELLLCFIQWQQCWIVSKAHCFLFKTANSQCISVMGEVIKSCSLHWSLCSLTTRLTALILVHSHHTCFERGCCYPKHSHIWFCRIALILLDQAIETLHESQDFGNSLHPTVDDRP